MPGADEIEGNGITTCKGELQKLHQVCSATLEQTFSDGREPKVATVMQFSADFEVWRKTLGSRPEDRLLSDANREVTVGLLNLVQGQYRNAFKSLRLVLELTLQGVYLSANLLELEEWLKNERHTSWMQLTDPDNGPLGTRFCRSFFPELKEHRHAMLSMASTVYTEFSETIHGNTPYLIPLPESMAFCEDAFELWCTKFETVKLIVHFTLCLRYLCLLNEASQESLLDIMNENLGHIAEVRVLLGGVKSS